MICVQVTSQSHSSVVGQTVGVPAHHGHAVHAAAPAHAVPALAGHAGHVGHAGHSLGKREAEADADAQLVGPDHLKRLFNAMNDFNSSHLSTDLTTRLNYSYILHIFNWPDPGPYDEDSLTR